jgi:hypothetical protein
MNKCSLFQVNITDEQLNAWFPLKCSIENPQNCGPTALVLTSVIPRQKGQEISPRTEEAGIQLNEFTQIMNDYMPRHNINMVTDQPMATIDNIIQELQPGYITLLGVAREPIGVGVGGRHITTIAKDSRGNVYIIEGQHNACYMNEAAMNFLMGYKYFYYWCSEIKLKRKISDIYSVIRRPQPELYGPPIKKKRIGGKSKKINKKRRKYKKTKRNKYSRKIYK